MRRSRRMPTIEPTIPQRVSMGKPAWGRSCTSEPPKMPASKHGILRAVSAMRAAANLMP